MKRWGLATWRRTQPRPAGPGNQPDEQEEEEEEEEELAFLNIDVLIRFLTRSSSFITKRRGPGVSYLCCIIVSKSSQKLT